MPNAIYINSVPEETTEADLRAEFEKYGEIKMINSRHIATGVPTQPARGGDRAAQGFAFIFFSSERAAAAGTCQAADWADDCTALENPRVHIHGKPVNILAKKQLVPKDRSTPSSRS